MRNADPILMRRMLALRQFPMFEHVDLGELVVVAENVVERTFAAGERIERGDSLHLVLDGALTTDNCLVTARQALGALEIVAHRPSGSATASLPTRTFEIESSDYLEVLEDSFGLLLATIRGLAARVAVLEVRRRSELPSVDAIRLGLVERMIVLRQQFPLATTRLEALAILADAATETWWHPGNVIRWTAGPVDGALVVVAGTARSGDRLLEAGDAIGFVEALAGLHHGATIEAVTAVRVLESRATTLFDVLEDHADAGLAVARTLAQALLDEPRAGVADRLRDAQTKRVTDAASTLWFRSRWPK